MLKRQKQVTVRFTEEEYHQLKNKCDAAGMKMEPFLRALVSGCTIRERPPDSYKALAAQVAAVGNNLNQLTRLANSTGKIENAQLAEASRIMNCAAKIDCLLWKQTDTGNPTASGNTKKKAHPRCAVW